MLQSVNDNLEDRMSDIRGLAEFTGETLKDIRNVHEVMDNKFHVITGTVGTTLEQIKTVGEELGRTTEYVDDVTERAIERFDRVGDRIREKSEDLDGAADRTTQVASFLASKIKEDTDYMLSSTKETLSSLEDMSEKTLHHIRDMNEAIKQSKDSASEYGKDLQDQADLVADAAKGTVDQVRKAIASLTGTLDDVANASDRVSLSINKSRDELEMESERLASVVSTAIKATDDATKTFSSQSGILQKTIDDVSKHTKEIRTEDARVQREAFMGTAKFIVENLHSLSVDLTRKAEGEVPEKVWKAYKKGDLSAFTRRLAGLGDDLPMKKLQDKFIIDTEFRNYVQRFIREFEDMYEQGQANDHGDILASTFVSSEIGRLYVILCKIAGRRDITSGQTVLKQFA